jgi:hypothetical protein
MNENVDNWSNKYDHFSQNILNRTYWQASLIEKNDFGSLMGKNLGLGLYSSRSFSWAVAKENHSLGVK